LETLNIGDGGNTPSHSPKKIPLSVSSRRLFLEKVTLRGMADLRFLRSRDLVSWVFSLISFVIDLVGYFLPYAKEQIFITSVCFGGFLVLDYIIRMINPSFALMDLFTKIVRKHIFKGPDIPFPKQSLYGRYAIFLCLFAIKLGVELGYKKSDPKVALIISALPLFMLFPSWAFHFCAGYLPYTVLLMLGKVRMSKDMPAGTYQFTCMGPSYTLIPRTATEVRSITAPNHVIVST